MRLVKPAVLSGAMMVSAMAADAATVVVDSLAADPTAFDFSTNPDGLRLFNIAETASGSLSNRPLGQSFTLGGASASDLSIEALIGGFGASASVTATLVEGAGFGGAEIGSTGPVFVATPGRDGVLTEFDFASLGPISAGVYTVFFSGTGALGGGTVNVLGPNNFVGVDTPGTEAFDDSGLFDFASNPARDFGIRVTAEIAPVPLPAGMSLLPAAMAGLWAMRRRGTA